MVVPAALSAERLPAPPARGPRVPVALSLALHGLAIVPLLLAGMSGSSANDDEAALMVELSLAAPTAGPAVETDQPETAPEPHQRPEPPTPPVETVEVEPPPEPEPPAPQAVVTAEPEIKLELPPPDEPPPPTAAEMKPVAPPKPKPPQPRPAAAPRPKAQATVTRAPSPDAGNASITQQEAASSSLVVFEGRPRYRIPPTPAVYPPRAIELGQQGEVLVRVRLDPDGTAAEIMVWRSSRFPLLDRSALAAVRGWHFLPAIRNGRPVAAWVEIPVRFHLR